MDSQCGAEFLDTNLVFGLALPRQVISTAVSRANHAAGQPLQDLRLVDVLHNPAQNWFLRLLANGKACFLELFRSRHECYFQVLWVRWSGNERWTSMFYFHLLPKRTVFPVILRFRRTGKKPCMLEEVVHPLLLGCYIDLNQRTCTVRLDNDLTRCRSGLTEGSCQLLRSALSHWDIHFLHIWFRHNCKTWWLSPLVLTWTWLTFVLCFDLCLERFEKPHVSTRTRFRRYSAGSCSTLKEKSAYRQSTACNSHPFSSSSLLGLVSWCVIPPA